MWKIICAPKEIESCFNSCFLKHCVATDHNQCLSTIWRSRVISYPKNFMSQFYLWLWNQLICQVLILVLLSLLWIVSSKFCVFSYSYLYYLSFSHLQLIYQYQTLSRRPYCPIYQKTTLLYSNLFIEIIFYLQFYFTENLLPTQKTTLWGVIQLKVIKSFIH